MRNQADVDKYLDKLIQNAEKRATKIFAERMKLILQEVSDMYAKYEKDGKLTLADMSRFNRLQSLYDSIAKHLVKAFEDAYVLIQETRKQAYLESYFRSAYVYEMSTQLRMGFGAIDPNAVEIAVENPIPRLKLPKIMERDRNFIISKIQESVAAGLAAGESYGKMAHRIRDAVGFGEYKARTVARTEAGKAQSKARLDSMKIAGQFVQTDKKWIATHDLRTRHSHRELDGQLAGNNGTFDFHGHHAEAPRLFGVPELDINCRCSFIVVIEGKVPEVRRARDYRDIDYQQRLADRIYHYMAQGMTEIAAQRQARKEVMPPSVVTKYQNYDAWYQDLAA